MAWVSNGCGLISTKVRVLDAGGGDGLAEPHRVAQIGHPVLGIENRSRRLWSAGGGDDRDRRRLRGQIGKRRPQLGQYRINNRMVRRHIHLDAPRQPVLGVHHRDHAHRPARAARRSRVWRGEAYTAKVTSG